MISVIIPERDQSLVRKATLFCHPLRLMLFDIANLLLRQQARAIAQRATSHSKKRMRALMEDRFSEILLSGFFGVRALPQQNDGLTS